LHSLLLAHSELVIHLPDYLCWVLVKVLLILECVRRCWNSIWGSILTEICWSNWPLLTLRAPLWSLIFSSLVLESGINIIVIGGFQSFVLYSLLPHRKSSLVFIRDLGCAGRLLLVCLSVLRGSILVRVGLLHSFRLVLASILDLRPSAFSVLQLFIVLELLWNSSSHWSCIIFVGMRVKLLFGALCSPSWSFFSSISWIYIIACLCFWLSNCEFTTLLIGEKLLLRWWSNVAQLCNLSGLLLPLLLLLLELLIFFSHEISSFMLGWVWWGPQSSSSLFIVCLIILWINQKLLWFSLLISRLPKILWWNGSSSSPSIHFSIMRRICCSTSLKSSWFSLSGLRHRIRSSLLKSTYRLLSTSLGKMARRINLIFRVISLSRRRITLKWRWTPQVIKPIQGAIVIREAPIEFFIAWISICIASSGGIGVRSSGVVGIMFYNIVFLKCSFIVYKLIGRIRFLEIACRTLQRGRKALWSHWAIERFIWGAIWWFWTIANQISAWIRGMANTRQPLILVTTKSYYSLGRRLLSFGVRAEFWLIKSAWSIENRHFSICF